MRDVERDRLGGDRVGSIDDAWVNLLNAASEPYRAAGRFAYHFAKGKLGRDPVFRHLVQSGLLVPPSQQGPLRMLDLGSGQSLLASLVHRMRVMHEQSRWPTSWPAPPQGLRYTGVELMGKDVERARQALARLPEVPTIVESDMTRVDFEPCDVVVILDVLHYVDITAQDRVLERVHSALRPGGRLLLRIGDRSSARGFAASQWVDRVVTAIRGHTVAPTWGRPLEQWQGTLTRLGFAVKAVPKSEGTPFANVLLVGDRR